MTLKDANISILTQLTLQYGAEALNTSRSSCIYLFSPSAVLLESLGSSYISLLRANLGPPGIRIDQYPDGLIIARVTGISNIYTSCNAER